MANPALRDRFPALRHWRKALVSAALALGLALSFQVKPASAGGKWVGPAIVGAFVGAAIASHAYRHHPYPYYYAPYKRSYYYPYYKRHRHHHHHHHHRPVVVVPYPHFGVYAGW